MLSEQEKRDLALTIAGEIHPRLTRHGTDEARAEIASILQSIENRRDLSPERYTTFSDVVKEPAQYSTWNDSRGRAVAARNYAQYSTEIDNAVEDYFSGKLESSTPMVTNYWSPRGMINENGTTAPSWAPAITDRSPVGPHVFGTDRSLVDDMQNLWVDSRIAAPYLGAPTPTGRGVSQAAHTVRSMMLDPTSGNMGLAPRQEPAWSDQFAPGPKAAPKSAIQDQPVRGDYPTGPLNPEPWQDQYAPAPPYNPRTASPARFEKTFALSDPQAPPLTPGTSSTAKAAAYRGLADSLRQAGIGGLDGRAAERSRTGIDQHGSFHPKQSLSHPPLVSSTPGFIPDIDSVPTPTARPPVSATSRFTPPVPSGRPPAPGSFTPPVPRARPQSVTPTPRVRPSVPTRSKVPLPTPRPSTYSALPMTTPHRDQMNQQPSPYTGPKKQIFDFVLRQLLEPAPGPK